MNVSKRREIEKNTIEGILNRLKVPASSFQFVLCPSPSLAESYEVEFSDEFEISEIEVWKLPIDYGLSQIC
jgi:hypothetical protein